MKKSEAYVEHRPSVRFNRIRQNAMNDFNKFLSGGKIVLKKNELCYCGSKNFEKLSSIDRYGLNFPTIKSLLDLRAKYEKRVNSIKYFLINNIKNILFFLISFIK